jgi:hypothetical protein
VGANGAHGRLESVRSNGSLLSGKSWDWEFGLSVDIWRQEAEQEETEERDNVDRFSHLKIPQLTLNSG